MPTPNAYPRETLAAVKFEAIVVLDLANIRMKDFYDMLAMLRLTAVRVRRRNAGCDDSRDIHEARYAGAVRTSPFADGRHFRGSPKGGAVAIVSRPRAAADRRIGLADSGSRGWRLHHAGGSCGHRRSANAGTLEYGRRLETGDMTETDQDAIFISHASPEANAVTVWLGARLRSPTTESLPWDNLWKTTGSKQHKSFIMSVLYQYHGGEGGIRTLGRAL